MGMVNIRMDDKIMDHGGTFPFPHPPHRNSYEKGTPCFRQLVRRFGPQIVGEDGAIDRRALGGIVFADPGKRKELEGIVWPEIRRLMERDIEALGEVSFLGLEGGGFLFIVVALVVILAPCLHQTTSHPNVNAYMHPCMPACMRVDGRGDGGGGGGGDAGGGVAGRDGRGVGRGGGAGGG